MTLNSALHRTREPTLSWLRLNRLLRRYSANSPMDCQKFSKNPGIRYGLGVLAVLGCLLSFTSGCAILRIEPEDQDLSDEDEIRARAFSKYSWGLILEREQAPGKSDHEDFYLAALNLMPGSQVILEQLVFPWIQKEDYDRLTEKLLPLAQKHPQAEQLQIIVSTALEELERHPEALRLLERAYRKNRHESSRIFREVIIRHWREENYSRVERLLDHARRWAAASTDFELALTLAVFYFELSQIDRSPTHPSLRPKSFSLLALTHAADAALLVDEDTPFDDFFHLFTVFEQSEQRRIALRLLELGESIYPDRQAELYFQQARMHRNLGETEAALRKLTEIEKISPREFGAYARLGREFLELDADRKARYYLNHAHRMRRDNNYVRLLLAYAQNRLSMFEETYRLLEPVTDSSPHAALLRSWAALEMERMEEALELAEYSWELAEEAEDDRFFTISFYLYQAHIHALAGNRERSLEIAEKAYENNPQAPEVNNFLGYSLADDNQQLDRAYVLIKTAVKAEPRNPLFRDSLAWLYYRQGKISEALREINLTLKLAEKEGDVHPVIFSHAGDIYAAYGYQRLAVLYWRQAVIHQSRERQRLIRKIEEIICETR